MSAKKKGITEPICHYCVHYLGSRLCSVFPDGAGIPEKIWTMEHDHRQPFPGDNGIVFKSTMKASEGK